MMPDRFVEWAFKLTLSEFVASALRAEAHTRQRMIGQLEGAMESIRAAPMPANRLPNGNFVINGLEYHPNEVFAGDHEPPVEVPLDERQDFGGGFKDEWA